MAEIIPTGMPTRSISFAIVAPQRLQVPQVATSSAPSTPPALRSAAMLRPCPAGTGGPRPRGPHAGRRVDGGVPRADRPPPLEVAQERERKDVVRIAVDEV